ncbi:vacuolar protein sorting-associated protein 9A-like [Dorcoceras hygrometricum]|uniref:Vacuolar protein sorting-associated protein 9A-like n=1 Tax=Dorcoceras hygrometricum TaxID=472368 RepID=A0A2Z7CJU1_9LAMI|nr:vacuolar protein sorting-associated protein 9A-like [Dorcoceras hygrometricum]
MTSAYILEKAMSSKNDVITISSYQEVQDLESAMMTSAVMSSQSADEESSAGALSVDDVSSDVITISRELYRWFAMTKPAGISSQEKPAGSNSTSRRKQQYIQTRKLQCIQSQAVQDQRLDNQSQHNEKKNQMRSCCKGKRFYTSRLDCKGAKTRRRKETAVARSVVTKKRQQLSEQLLNNLLKIYLWCSSGEFLCIQEQEMPIFIFVCCKITWSEDSVTSTWDKIGD